ncbi:MAG: hypothetical protein GQ570_03575 [Helicobacteraceae bacterium]|nr:hypothetical protein [Helicobacteraceae bacterium]
MKIKTSYNGWSPEVRSVRGTEFYNMLRRGEIEQKGKCGMCGVPAKFAPLQFHAEEYGPTWEDYFFHTYEVCCHCHGMIHVRYKHKDAWWIYLKAIAEQGPQQIFTNIGTFFTQVKRTGVTPIVGTHGNKPPAPFVSGNSDIDNIPPKPYYGTYKVPTLHDEDGVVIPDWDCLTADQKLEFKKDTPL